MKRKYNHFENEISGTYGQANFGTFLWQMAIVAVIVVLGIIFLK